MNALRNLSPKPRLVLGLLLAATLLLTACGAGAGESWAGLAASSGNDSIFVSNNGKLVALDSTTGEVRWDYAPQGSKFYAVPAVEDGTVFVGDYSGNLHAVSAETGEMIWEYKPPRETLVGPLSKEAPDRVIGGATVGPDMIYYGLGSHNVVAVSRETHNKAWTFKTDHGVWSAPAYIAADAEAGIDRDMLLVTSLDHYLYAIDAETGDRLWDVDLGGAVPGGVTYDADRHLAYMGTFLSEIVALDVTTHEIVDRFETQDWVWARPALDDGGTLYFGDLAGNLYSVRITGSTLTQNWTRPVAEGPIRATPVVTDDLVIASSKDKNVYAVNKQDGTNRWYTSTDGEALTDLVLIPQNAQTELDSGLVVVGTTNNKKLVVAYAVNSGEADWQYAD